MKPMDTLSVNIAYRPMRICWVIKAGDHASFREAVRINHTLWGGRFNPIVVVNCASEAHAKVEAFRADIVWPLGESKEVEEFASSFKHLISPFVNEGMYIGQGQETRAQVLDLQNAFAYARSTPEWTQIQECKPHIYKWEADDPLADVFLIMLGAYPDIASIGINYERLFKEALDANEIAIDSASALPADLFEQFSVAQMSQYMLRRHHSIHSGWSHHGFYFGDASKLEDLVAFWNLRASDLGLSFVDCANPERFGGQIQSWKNQMEVRFARWQPGKDPKYAIWRRREENGDVKDFDALKSSFGTDPYMLYHEDEALWNGLNLRPPMMHFGEVTSLGFVADVDKPKISFGLDHRPYATDAWFHNQHLVASVSVIGGLYERDDFTFDPPYLPELNEFFARTMYFQYDRLRVESERIGLIVTAVDSNSFVCALPTAELFKRIFALAGFKASISEGGLIARQLLAQLGGVQGGRVFKIPGVRRLLKTHGPTSSFKKTDALQLICCKDKDNPGASFSDFNNLYIEPREQGASLTPINVFSYLVGKGLYRIGTDLKCPSCQLGNWFPVDDLRQRLSCQMCGVTFESTKQLICSEWTYRRSGVLGKERNAQGSVPVVLTLQQLDTNLSQGLQRRAISVSLDLIPTRKQLPQKCEVDFAWLIPRSYPERTIVIIGECKDRGQAPNSGGDGGTINEKDIANLRAVADSFPSKRFEVYVLLAKLCPFTPSEIELARSLNNTHQQRVIMLTERELEPYHLFDRTAKLFKIMRYGGAPADLARATVAIYLDPDPITTS